MNIHLQRALLLMEQSRHELAEEQLRMALAEDSADAIAHASLAACLLARENYDEATMEAEQAIHISPDESIGFYYLAAIMHQRNRLKEAHQAVSEAIRIDPCDSRQFALLAAIELDRSRWKDSLAAADQGLEFNPESVDCTNLRAMALVKLGRREEAGQSIASVLINEPDNADTHANLGWTLLHAGDPKKAAEHFREALRLDPNSEWARHGIIEAMKARNPIYRYMLAFFLRMGRLSPRVQIAMVLGLLFGNQLLQSVCRSVPLLAPLATPFTIGYVLFVWMSWTSSSLFNLVLCLDRFGRLVLNQSEKLCAGLVGLCIVATLAIGLTGEVRYSGQGFSGLWISAALFLGLTIPVSSIFNAVGKRQLMMIAYTCGLLGVILTTLYYDVRFSEFITGLDRGQQPTPEELDIAVGYRGVWSHWLSNSITGIAISTWLGMGMSVIPNRK